MGARAAGPWFGIVPGPGRGFTTFEPSRCRGEAPSGVRAGVVGARERAGSGRLPAGDRLLTTAAIAVP